MFEDDPNSPEEEAKDASSDSPADTAGADSQVSDITTESSETQAEAEVEGDGAEGAEAAEAAEAAGDDAASEESTAEEEGSEGGPVAAEPKRNPLLDYEAPDYGSIEEAIEDQIEQTSTSLQVNEDLMMSCIQRDDVHNSYFELWRDDANLYFRSLCIYRMRLQKLKERQAAAQAKKDEAKEDPTPKKETTDAAV